MSENINSLNIFFDQYILGGVQAIWTGSPVGTLKIQVSCDPPNEIGSLYPGAPTNWADIPDSIVSLIGVAGSYYYPLNNLGCECIRLFYISIS